MSREQVRDTRSVIAGLMASFGCGATSIAEVLALKTKAGRPDKNRARNLSARGRRLLFQTFTDKHS